MRINISLDQIAGRHPAEVSHLLQTLGIDPARPYRANVTFSGVTIEQEREREALPS